MMFIYINIDQMGKKLKFIHITKTAGTTIENVGRIKGKYWGRYDMLLKHLNYKTNDGPFWHIPLRYTTKHYLKYILKHYNLFTVVRNPYERCVSEFYCRWGGPNKKNVNVNQFNNIIKNKLNKPHISNHWAPQYLYIYDSDDNKIVKHVLKYEKIKKQFNKLMKKYNNGIRLNEYYNKHLKKFTTKDLFEDTKDLIKQVYHEDFVRFKYDF